MDIEYLTPDIPYAEALQRQEQAVADILAGTGKEKAFFCEHSPVYTLGTSAQPSDILNKFDIPAIKTGRGGKVTYHGNGQRVVYPIIDLSRRKKDVRQHICNLQKCLISTLKDFGLSAHCTDDIGVWVDTKTGPEKIAAIGIRVRKWVTFHGFALNVNPDMNHFSGIIPCGIHDKGVTSMEELGVPVAMEEVDKSLQKHLDKAFIPL